VPLEITRKPASAAALAGAVTSNLVWPLVSVAVQVTSSMQGTATWSTWNEPEVVPVRPELDASREYVPGALIEGFPNQDEVPPRGIQPRGLIAGPGLRPVYFVLSSTSFLSASTPCSTSS
jgi:hypothetical protein